MLQVPDCQTPEFWKHMDRLVALNQQLDQVSNSARPAWLQHLQKIPIYQQFAVELGALFFGKSILAGSFDVHTQTQLVY